MLNEQKKISPSEPRRAAVVDLHQRRPVAPLRLAGQAHQPSAKPPMKRSLLLSAALHAAVILMMWIGLPLFLPPLPPPMILVPVEITDIGAITNTRIKPDPMPEPKPQPQPAKEEKPQPPPPPEEKPPEPPKPEPKPVEEKAEALPVPEKKPEPKKPEPKKAEEKPKPKPRPDLLASVLKNVAQIKPKPAAKTEEEAEEEATEDAQPAPSLSDKLTISEEDALRRQIGQCWNMPIGARDAHELIVEVVIDVNQDRTVRSVQIVDTARMASDPFFRAAAESAVRALRSPLCTPLALPPDKYDQWQRIHFNFDPRDML